MTRIKKLVMHGFKSFARRTEVPFGDKFNVVLGPNGSGKSNVIDALCFVLGRMGSKSLRAEKSANLIYNGGKTKKPSSFALVEIHFDNEKKEFPVNADTVIVSRKLLPTGNSIYKINDSKASRKEVIDLMALAKIDPDGYNIILQGDIIRFIEMSAEDRRKMIEEISDISAYEDKKQKAILELDKVEEKLKEAHIVLTERKTYLDELKTEHDQALKYKNMKDKIDSNKATFFWLQIESREKRKKELEDKMDGVKKEIEKLNKTISDMKSQKEKKEREIDRINKEVEEKGEKGQIDVHKVIEDLKIQINSQKLRIETCKDELAKIRNRRLQLKKSMEEIDGKTSGIREEERMMEQDKKSMEKEKAALLEKLDAFKKKFNLEGAAEIEKKIEELDKEAEKIQVELDNLRGRQQELIREKDRQEILISGIDDRMKKVAEIAKEHQKELEDLKVKKMDFKQITIKINKMITDESALAAKLAAKQKDLYNLRDEYAQAKGRSASIKAQITGNLAINKIIEDKSRFKGVFGTVATLGSVQSKFSTAVDVAAGGHLTDIVVDTADTATRCIDYLKQNQFGVATFLPLDKLKDFPIGADAKKLSTASGCHGFAGDLVKYDARFAKIFRFVFRDTIVVDDLQVAKRIGIGQIRMVTLDGDLAEHTGAMKGGFRDKKMKSLGFQEQELSRHMDDVSEKLSKLENEVKAMEKEKDAIAQGIYDLRQKKAELEGEIIKGEKSLHLDSEDIESDKGRKEELAKGIRESDAELFKITGEIGKRLSKITEVKQAKERLRFDVSKIRDPKVIAEMSTYNERLEKLNNEMNELGNKIRANELRITEVHGKEAISIKQILNELDRQENDFKKEMIEKEAGLGKMNIDLKEKEKKAEEFYSKYKELFKERNKLADESRQLEKEISETQEKIRDEEYKMNGVSLDKATIVAQIAGLQEEFEPYRNAERVENKGVKQLKSEIDEFEKMMTEMGAVNLKALEVFDKVNEEYLELMKKKEKLHEEKDEVMKMMAEIEGKKQELFMKTFDMLKDQFSSFFQRLSIKGEAHLVLENPEKPLEAGVRVKVRLSSQRYMDIRSLSGGEKTLTALAFIFAIQEFEPATFYVMDEVDAALDKQNSEKLAKLVASYSKKAQYVVISHNDYLIQNADTLFGVSMDEHSVSKLISLKV